MTKIIWKWSENPPLAQLEAAQDEIIEFPATGRKWPATQTGFDQVTNLIDEEEQQWMELYMRFPGVGEMATTFRFPGFLKGENMGEGWDEWPSGVTDGFNWLAVPEGMERHGEVIKECLRIAKRRFPQLLLEDELIHEVA
jgi:hypothetical protein